MAWTSDEWRQNDDQFYGYPIPLNTSAPETIDKSKLPTIWNFGSAFYGYPILADALVPETIDKSKLPTIWIFNNAFYGYPHTLPIQMESKYPILTAFSMEGIGAEFRQMKESKVISLPEKISFKFNIKERIYL